MKAFLSLTRFDNSLFASSAVIISGILSRDLTGFQLDYVIGVVVILLLSMATFAVNDYYDYTADKANNRVDRPLVQGLMKRKSALVIGVVLCGAAFIATLLLNRITSVFVLVHFPMPFLYSSHFKRMLFVKNVIVAYGFAAVCVFGSVISDATLEPLIVYFAVMAFIVGLAVEIMIDIADVEGDRRTGVITIPVKFSRRMAAEGSIILYMVIVVLDPVPFFVLIDSALYKDILFFVLIMVPVVSYIVVSASLSKNHSRAHILKLKRQVILIMQFGTLSYVIGVLV